MQVCFYIEVCWANIKMCI